MVGSVGMIILTGAVTIIMIPITVVDFTTTIIQTIVDITTAIVEVEVDFILTILTEVQTGDPQGDIKDWSTSPNFIQ